MQCTNYIYYVCICRIANIYTYLVYLMKMQVLFFFIRLHLPTYIVVSHISAVWGLQQIYCQKQRFTAASPLLMTTLIKNARVKVCMRGQETLPLIKITLIKKARANFISHYYSASLKSCVSLSEFLISHNKFEYF